MGYLHFKGNGVTVQLLETTSNKTYNAPLNEDYNLDVGTYNITITAENGFIINKVSYPNRYGSEVLFTLSEDGKTATENNHKVASYTQDVITIDTTATSDDGSNKVQEFTNLYLVDRSILKSIAGEDLVRTWGEPVTTIRVDLRDYIINVLELPFSVPNDLIGDELPIKLGEYELKTKAKEIKQDLLFLDLGSITVPYKYNNSLDFMNTTAKLYLPFIDVITLDIDYVINQVIYIEYVIDLFTGDTTLNLTSSKTGKNIYSKNFNLGRSIPFNAKHDVVVNNLSHTNGLYNEILTPYIEITRSKVNSLNEFDNMVDVESILLNEKGFIIVNEIDLKTSATSNEKNSIIQLLKNGVYIK